MYKETCGPAETPTPHPGCQLLGEGWQPSKTLARVLKRPHNRGMYSGLEGDSGFLPDSPDREFSWAGGCRAAFVTLRLLQSQLHRHRRVSLSLCLRRELLCSADDGADIRIPTGKPLFSVAVLSCSCSIPPLGVVDTPPQAWVTQQQPPESAVTFLSYC